jgi:iron complex transport system ATP-binding protein
VIELRDLSFGYGSPLFEHLSLRFAAGEVTALAGPNGSGKSTILRLAAGILEPHGGRVFAVGEALRGMDRIERAKRICFVPQNPILPEGWTVEEVVLLGDYPHTERPPAPRPLAGRLGEALEVLDLAGVRHRVVDSLSGGEAQRVVLARAFVQDTPVLVLDEPASHLDLRHQSSLLRFLDRMSRGGKAVVLATHDVNISLLYGHRLLLLDPERRVHPWPGEVSLQEKLLTRVYSLELIPVRFGDKTCFLPEAVLNGDAPKSR